MRRELEDCERQYCNAVTAFRTQGDDLNVARAYYNLSNALRTANRYRRAKRYLKQAEIIARRLNDETLLKKIPLLKERIRQRNRNVPNYAAGEGRADE
jgi:hypothetical protein